jgi:microcystin-dependent protein
MPWPAGGISTANLDSDSDSPALARVQLLAAVQQLNDVIASRGTASGIPSTGTDGLVPAAQGGVPTGSMMAYAGSSAPSGWLLCAGQAVSRTTYAALFSAISTAYGAGDGSTTFNLPDLRGRIPAGKDDMGGTAASRLQSIFTGATTTAGSAVVTGLSSGTGALAVGMSAFGSTLPAGVTIASIDSGTQITLSTGTGVTAGTTTLRFGYLDAQALGSSGGSQTHTLTTSQMPAHTHTVQAQASSGVNAGSFSVAMNTGATTLTSSSTGGGQAHSNVQPSVIANYIIKT